MTRRPAPLPESLPWRVFTRAEALRAGVLPGRLRRSDIARLRPGLLRRVGAPIGEADIASALCRDDPRAVVVGVSAARILGLPLPSPLETWRSGIPVQVSIPGGAVSSDRVVRWRGLVLAPDQVWSPRLEFVPTADEPARTPLPVRMTTRVRTWRDLAGTVPAFFLVAIGDHLVRRPRPGLEPGREEPWCTLDELRRMCTGRDTRALRHAVEQVRVGADSPRETLLRLAFLRAGLPEPQLNAPLTGVDGNRGHQADFLWPEYRVCAEYEGRHHSDPEQVSRDIERARRVEKAGWVEVRLHHHDVSEDCAVAVRLVRDALKARGWRPSASPSGDR
ncbi:endonuclease domain-containing protein [Brachybacterium vulturis]|uniref:endonuclease domain-containing protein n=1 Tax=Brachybacterium vulturis TaxID=2017484 RepID=UPI0037366C9D